MAFHDWNHDGKKDWQDDFIEYQIYKNSRKEKEDFTPSSSDGITTFGTILSIVGGLCLTVFIPVLVLGEYAVNIPGTVLIILWILFSIGLMFFCNKHGI